MVHEKKDSYIYPLLLCFLFKHLPPHTIPFDSIAFLYRVLMLSSFVFLPTRTTAHSLNSVIPRTACSRMSSRQSLTRCQHSKRLRRLTAISHEIHSCINSGTEVGLCHHGCRTGKILGDFDLDIAQISLSCRSSALLLAWIVCLRCARWSALQSTVPVMGHEGFAFVPLRGSMRINVVHVRKVGLKAA